MFTYSETSMFVFATSTFSILFGILNAYLVLRIDFRRQYHDLEALPVDKKERMH